MLEDTWQQWSDSIKCLASHVVTNCLWFTQWAYAVVACVCARTSWCWSTLCEEDIDSILTGCWLSSLQEDEACLDVGWESQHRGVMRQSDREAEGERRAYVRAEDDDNKLSLTADTNTALSGSDYLQHDSKRSPNIHASHTCASNKVSTSPLITHATFHSKLVDKSIY